LPISGQDVGDGRRLTADDCRGLQHFSVHFLFIINTYIIHVLGEEEDVALVLFEAI
jgi:hypothetical protein